MASACCWFAMRSKETSSDGLGDALDDAGVLDRKEPLGDRRIEIAGQEEGAERDEERDPLMVEHDLRLAA